MLMLGWLRRASRKAGEILRHPQWLRELRATQLLVMRRRNGVGAGVAAGADGGRKLWERLELR
jgi:hypothetical protein